MLEIRQPDSGPGGDRMKKIPVVVLLLLAFILGPVYAEKLNSSTVTIASAVKPRESINPAIIIGLGSTELTYYTRPEQEKTVISGLDLMEDGTFNFALMTSNEVFIGNDKNSISLEIEIVADGFHRYDYNYTGSFEGSSLDHASIRQRNAVPLLSFEPEINIPGFYGNNENVSVSHLGAMNKIVVTFKKGLTREGLMLGTFKVEWKGRRPLATGIYKANVSVSYSIQ